jgi:cytosine/adenosine deaminase-related metal-dependent hydrolase
MMATKTLPVEVELALQVMPCQAMRRSYTPGRDPHACSHFAEWGVFHSFDYKEDGPPAQPGISQPSTYAGKRPVTPEILSGCRKAPILAVGINPNLPGWSTTTRNAIHPYFEDYLQYAHYFRWRATDKLRIPRDTYNELRPEPPAEDGPFDRAPLMAEGDTVQVEHSSVTMYRGYQSLLDGLAERMGWQNHRLAVGEDLAYANMVACGSARWTTRPVQGMPFMGERAAAIVKECFHDRKYFLRQMLQSLPAVVMVFSQTTADAFIGAMQGRFSKGDPKVGERLADLIGREIRLRFGRTADGQELDARVVFSPHASANPQDFAAQREVLIGHLVAEVQTGTLSLNPATGRLARTKGGCQFCTNALYSIGACDYKAELRPLSAGAGIQPLADDGSGPDPGAERAEHMRLVAEFTADPSVAAGPAFDLLDADAPNAPKLVLLGDVVPMDGPALKNAAVYLNKGSIIAVQKATDPPPQGFALAKKVDTGGVIYPGLADLHNHLAYNALSLWWPSKARTNRSQWLGDSGYKSLVSEPMKVVRGRQDLVRALIRYIEVKLILGGVTSGQGMNTNVGGKAYFHGGVRNFEQSDDPALPQIRHRVPDFRDVHRASIQDAHDEGVKYFLHLAEGTNEGARAQFTLLQDWNLVWPNLCGIHSLGLNRDDLKALAAKGGSVVWSPFSNSLLYGRTIRVQDLLDSGARFALGSDWTPSGSRNILEELKIAKLTAEAEGAPLTTERLANAVTSDAFAMAGWDKHLGKVKAGYYADLVVLDRKKADPYDNLVAATEREVRMVLIGGQPRHGNLDLMTAAGIAPGDLERITVGGVEKALFLKHQASPLNHITFAAARDALERAFADLPAAREATVFEPFDDGPKIEIELDMDEVDDETADDAFDFLADAELPQSIPLDGPTIVDDDAYWARLDSVPHLPPFLKGSNGLKRYYQ